MMPLTTSAAWTRRMSDPSDLDEWLVTAAGDWCAFYHVKRGVPQSTVDEALGFFRSACPDHVWRCGPYIYGDSDRYDRTIVVAAVRGRPDMTTIYRSQSRDSYIHVSYLNLLDPR